MSKPQIQNTQAGGRVQKVDAGMCKVILWGTSYTRIYIYTYIYIHLYIHVYVYTCIYNMRIWEGTWRKIGVCQYDPAVEGDFSAEWMCQHHASRRFEMFVVLCGFCGYGSNAGPYGKPQTLTLNQNLK